MIRRAIVIALTVAAVVGLGVQAGGAAQEAHAEPQTYRTCRAMHRDWPSGVAKTRRAAIREVADGHGRAHVGRRLYRANRNLDRNDDRVACEA
jgi:hypothetical protein